MGLPLVGLLLGGQSAAGQAGRRLCALARRLAQYMHLGSGQLPWFVTTQPCDVLGEERPDMQKIAILSTW